MLALNYLFKSCQKEKQHLSVNLLDMIMTAIIIMIIMINVKVKM